MHCNQLKENGKLNAKPWFMDEKVLSIFLESVFIYSNRMENVTSKIHFSSFQKRVRLQKKSGRKKAKRGKQWEETLKQFYLFRNNVQKIDSKVSIGNLFLLKWKCERWQIFACIFAIFFNLMAFLLLPRSTEQRDLNECQLVLIVI